MKKTERILQMLKLISIDPGISPESLGQLTEISERGVYRYIADLREIGIPIKCKNGGYVLENRDLLSVIKAGAAENPESDEAEAVMYRDIPLNIARMIDAFLEFLSSKQIELIRFDAEVGGYHNLTEEEISEIGNQLEKEMEAADNGTGREKTESNE